MDSIFIHNIRCNAIIGIHSFERIKPQRIIISLDLFTDTRQAAETDDINDALNYFAITQFVEEFVANSNYQLIERLADTLATKLLDNYPIKMVKLRLEKPSALPQTQQVGVEIYREKTKL